MSTLTARVFGRRAAVDRPIVPSPAEPMGVARELIRVRYSNADHFVLRDHRGDFYRWTGTCWASLATPDVKAAIYRFLEHAQYIDPKYGDLRPFAPTRKKVADVVEAMRAIVILESSSNAPMWTEPTADDPPVREIVSMANGLLHIPTRTLQQHTPRFFAHHALPFPFIPDTPPPTRWLAFLHEQREDDDSSIAALQETTGYLLCGDTRFQKIFLLVGPKRAGKGTYGRVLTGLLGPHNVAAPTLASLGTNFGLQALIGRPLAIISDARLSNKADGTIVVERLLSISGEDSQTVDRKHRDHWTGRLPTRFLILTNELPRLTDSAGALASRFVPFVLRRSFYGRENPHLADELLSEASAIFNWALEGLDRLIARGHFLTPASGTEAIRQLEELSSPVLAFIRDRCQMGPQFDISQQQLFKEWLRWSGETGQERPGTIQTFGRDLRAALPAVNQVQHRDESGIPRRYYHGLRLRD